MKRTAISSFPAPPRGAFKDLRLWEFLQEDSGDSGSVSQVADRRDSHPLQTQPLVALKGQSRENLVVTCCVRSEYRQLGVAFLEATWAIRNVGGGRNLLSTGRQQQQIPFTGCSWVPGPERINYFLQVLFLILTTPREVCYFLLAFIRKLKLGGVIQPLLCV